MPILAESQRHETTYVTISRDEYESMQATIETLSDPELMEQLKKSEEDIRTGRTKNWSEIIKELNK